MFLVLKLNLVATRLKYRNFGALIESLDENSGSATHYLRTPGVCDNSVKLTYQRLKYWKTL